jgi:hypothetical protein
VAGSCEHGNGTSGSIKTGNSLTTSVTARFSRGTSLCGFGWLVGRSVGWLSGT